MSLSFHQLILVVFNLSWWCSLPLLRAKPALLKKKTIISKDWREWSPGMPSFQCNSSFSSLGTSAWRLADSMTSCFKHSFPCQDQILGLYRHFFVQKPTSGVPQTLWCMQCGQWVFYAAFFDPLEQSKKYTCWASLDTLCRCSVVYCLYWCC